MRSWARCAGVVFLLCACQSATPAGPCLNESSCPAMHACVDGECVPKQSDAGGVVPGTDAGRSCTPVERAIAARSPLDIVLLVDDEHAQGTLGPLIRDAVTTALVPALEAAEVDYEIVLVAGCEYELMDVPADRYTRFPLILHSTNDFETLLDNYRTRRRPSFSFDDLVRLNRCLPISSIEGMPGWQSLLRPSAMKVFVHFADTTGRAEGIDNYRGGFDEALMELDPDMFGAADATRLVYHVFGGILGRDAADGAALFCASEPIVTQRCIMRGESRSIVYQESARRTGGYRGALCDTDRFAEGMDAITARTVALSNDCRVVVDDPSVDLETLTLHWTDASSRDIARASDASGCTGEAFYVEGTTVVLCPAVCDLLRGSSCAPAAESGSLTARWGCEAP